MDNDRQKKYAGIQSPMAAVRIGDGRWLTEASFTSLRVPRDRERYGCTTRLWRKSRFAILSSQDQAYAIWFDKQQAP
jgi:hypothetical protein